MLIDWINQTQTFSSEYSIYELFPNVLENQYWRIHNYNKYINRIALSLIPSILAVPKQSAAETDLPAESGHIWGLHDITVDCFIHPLNKAH